MIPLPTHTPYPRPARRRLALACCAALLALMGFDAGAQPTHELNDEGDFVKQSEPDPKTQEGQIQIIRRMLVAGDASKAEDTIDAWIEDHPVSPLLVEAYMIRGDAKVAQEDYYRALADYELVIGLYPGTEQYKTAIQREYDIAKLFIGGLKRKSSLFLGLRVFSADDVGVEMLIRVQERLPGSALGEKASIAIGDYYFDQGTMDMASEAYDLFLLNYPNSRQREWAMLRQIQASLARYKGPQFDPSGLTDAAQRLTEYMAEFPAAAEKIGAEALMVRIRESLAEKKLVTARWYEKRGLERGAITMFRRVIRDYPKTVAAQSALAELNERGVPLIDPRSPAIKKNKPAGDRPESGKPEKEVTGND